MFITLRKIRAIITILGLIVLGGYIWYNSLDESHKRTVANLAKQIPDLPGRYAI
jgi:hypothetical protein